MKTRFIYIGYPKTASTTIEQGFINKHPEIYNFSYEDDMWGYLCLDMIQPDLCYSADSAKDKFSRYFEKAESNEQCKAVGICFDHLCGCMVQNDVALMAKRMREVFGDAKIIITIRNQFDRTRSLYSEFVKSGMFMSFERFLEGLHGTFYTHNPKWNQY